MCGRMAWGAKIKSTISKWQEWWGIALISFLIGSVPGWYPIGKDIVDSFDPTFKARIVVDIHDNFNLICLNGGNYPVDFVLYMELTNNNKKSIEIIGYQIEEKISNKWIPMRRYPCPWILKINDEYAEVSLFDQSIFNKNIESGHTVKGWMAFSRQAAFRKKKSSEQFRLILFDNHGDKTYIKLRKPLEAEPIYGPEMRIISKPEWIK